MKDKRKIFLTKMDSAVEIKDEKPDFQELVYYSDLQVKQEPIIDSLLLELSKKCSLCSKNYDHDHHTFLLSTAQIRSFCTVLGICSDNFCFEEIFKSLELCPDCTGLVTEIDAQMGILRTAELCIRRCVQEMGSHLSDRLGSTENPAGQTADVESCLQNLEKLNSSRVKTMIANELGITQKFWLIATSK